MRLLWCWTLLVLVLLAAIDVFAVRHKKFYDTLGVPEDADDRVIKRAYKKQALKWHPDRHADKSASEKKKAEERFKDIAHAYETLSDPEKRRTYDQFGEEGLKQGGPGGPGGGAGGFQFHGDPFEMFNSFFGGGAGGGAGGTHRQFQFSTGGNSGGFQFHTSSGGFPGGGGGGGGFPGAGVGGRMGQQRGGGGGGLYDDDSNVITLDEASFPKSKENHWVYLVEFYAPWCGHCQQLVPKWKKVASSLRGVVKVAAINCDDHKQICGDRGVRGYPTIMALSPYSSSWQEYQGERSAAAISSWATGLIGNAASNLQRETELQALLQQCGGSSSSSSKKSSNKASSASWSLCLILVSQKSTMPSLWKALSVAYRGKVAFGFVSSGSAQVVQQLGSAGNLGTDQSRVISICNGDVRTAEAYKGTLKSEPLQRHISSYTAGKKCAQQVVLDASTDLATLKVAHLKTLVQAKGVDCTGCFEKGDYVLALKKWVEQQELGASDSKQEL